MATIGKVSAVFTASTSGLKAGVQDAGSSLRKLTSDISSMRSNLSTLTAVNVASFIGGIASRAAGAARSLIAMGQAEAEVIDQTSKLAARLGVTYGDMAGLALAGDLAGVSMDTIAAAATKADVALVKATQGSATAQAAFAGIGLSVDELAAMDPAARFSAISDAIAAIPSEAERSAAAVRLFGRSGAQLLPLFAGGAGGIREATEEARAFGLALTTTQGQDVEAMNDAFTRAGAAVKGVVTQVTAYLAPAIQSVADAFSGMVGDIGGTTIGQRIGEGILEGARFLAGVGDAMIGGLGSVWEYVSSVAVTWAGIFDTGSRVASVFAGVGRIFEGVFQFAIGTLGGLVDMMLDAARSVAGMLGVSSATLDQFAAGSRAFIEATRQSQDAAFRAAAENFDAATRPAADNAARAAAGPLTAAIDAAAQRAREAAAAGEQARGGLQRGPGPGAAAGGDARQALQAIDSRSREGIAEMFRLMRGQTEDVGERQLRVMERIADNTEEMGVDFTEVDLL